jgi:hypothetical protein
MKRTSTILVISSIAFALAACSPEANDSASHSSGLVFHKKNSGGSENVGSTKQALDDATCPDVVGMSVCDPAVPGLWYQCLYQWALSVGNTEDVARQIGQKAADSASNDCAAIQAEWQLCRDGITAAPCAAGPGHTAGESAPGGNTGETCTNCDCYGEYTDFHGLVCGDTATKLVDDCYNSCS